MTRKSSQQYAAQRRVRAAGAPRRPVAAEQQMLLDYEDLASRSALPIGTLRNLVRAGKGPRLIVIGKHHRFTPKDVADWIDDLRSMTEV